MCRMLLTFHILALVSELVLLALTAVDTAQLWKSDPSHKRDADKIAFLALSFAATCVCFAGNLLGAQYLLRQ